MEIRDLLDNAERDAILAGLEHLDQRYLRAVGYAAKAKRDGRPKMVLLADIVGNSDDAVGAAASEVVCIANARHGEGFTAVSTDSRWKFWLDRARTAAIARHTNAFKINEDVVISLERLGDYSDEIERINIELSLENKLALLDAVEELLVSELRINPEIENDAGPELLADRREAALVIVRRTRERWRWLTDHMDAPLADYAAWLQSAGQEANILCANEDGAEESVFRTLQKDSLRVSWKTETREPLMQLFDGRAFDPVRADIDATHKRILKSRLFIALHMHAGDGNVHTNIPVNSDDYSMLQEANQVVSRIMRLARSLGGAISGEHGIGITKLDYLDDDALRSFAEYKQRVDPEGRFNKGKLLPGANLDRAYTPSFSLLELESLILDQSEIRNISDSIKDCLRC